MFEDKPASGSKNCLNCGSENIIGPYKFYNASVHIGIFNRVRLRVLFCVDCGYTMFFTRKEHEYKIHREAERLQNRNQ